MRAREAATPASGREAVDAARVLVAHFGEEAVFRAARRLNACAADGDTAGRLAWTRVIGMIRVLRDTALADHPWQIN